MTATRLARPARRVHDLALSAVRAYVRVCVSVCACAFACVCVCVACASPPTLGASSVAGSCSSAIAGALSFFFRSCWSEALAEAAGGAFAAAAGFGVKNLRSTRKRCDEIGGLISRAAMRRGGYHQRNGSDDALEQSLDRFSSIRVCTVTRPRLFGFGSYTPGRRCRMMESRVRTHARCAPESRRAGELCVHVQK